VGWRITTNARIGFTLQVTATPGVHSLHDWCYPTIWLFSGALEDPEDDTIVEKLGSDALYFAVKSLIDAFRTEDRHTQ